MHDLGAVQEGVDHALVVDRTAHRVQQLGVVEVLVLLVDRQIVDRAGHVLLHLQVGIAANALNIHRGHFARHVDIAFFQQQTLGRGFGDMAHEHALSFGAPRQ